MSMTDHPITPPPELEQQWRRSAPADAAANNAYERHIATAAARWGADQELEACCEYIRRWFADPQYRIAELRAARRPKPPSLKEQALARLTSLEELAESMGHSPDDTIRRALEALPE